MNLQNELDETKRRPPANQQAGQPNLQVEGTEVVIRLGLEDLLLGVVQAADRKLRDSLAALKGA
ncbi:MAG: hypothetical protein QME79_14430 [Bacillota bacterium]|nr:hypothetical protein [Bacillota bacterium]